MFDVVRRAFGLVRVTERNGIITIAGLHTQTVQTLVRKLVGTNSFMKNVVIATTSSGFSFHSFFAVEIAYVFEKLRLDSTLPWKTRQVIRRTVEGLYTDTWLQQTTQPVKPMVDLRFLNKMVRRLKPHQEEFIKIYGTMLPKYNLRGYFLAAPPGTGKTLAELALAACVIPREIAQVKIIISPKNAIRLVWEKEIKEAFRSFPEAWVSDTPGEAPLGFEYYVFHYEAMDRAIALAQQLIKRKVRYFVAVDEAHNFNTPTSLRTQRLLQLCTMVPNIYQVWGSGTPIKALGVEIIPALTAFDPLFTPAVAAIFKKAFGSDKPALMEIVAHRFGIISYKVAKETVVSDKPTVIKYPITLKDPRPYLMSTIKEDMKEYFEAQLKYHQDNMSQYRKIFEFCVKAHKATINTSTAKREFNRWVDLVRQLQEASKRGSTLQPEVVSWIKTYEDTVLIPSLTPNNQKEFKQVRTAVKTLRQKIQGEVLGKLGQRRSQCSAALAREGDFTKIIEASIAKTLIFSAYIEPLRVVSEKLETLNFVPVRIYGPTSSQVTALVKKFTDIPELNPACATFDSLSTAVPVIVANTEILIDLPFRSHLYDQVVARVNRLGQTNPVFVYECYLDTGTIPNISQRAEEILNWSRDQVEVLMNDDVDVDLVGMEFTS